MGLLFNNPFLFRIPQFRSPDSIYMSYKGLNQYGDVDLWIAGLKISGSNGRLPAEGVKRLSVGENRFDFAEDFGDLFVVCEKFESMSRRLDFLLEERLVI